MPSGHGWSLGRSTPHVLGWPSGGLKTRMSPRSGSLNRSSPVDEHPRPTWSVGTIDSLGIRNGFTRKAWMPSARPSATATIVTNSMNELCSRFFSLPPSTGPGPSL